MSLATQLSKEYSSLKKELGSFKTPTSVRTATPPVIGSQAPSSAKLQLPAADGKPTIITFLRHCGCPFSEKNFLDLRKVAGQHPEAHFIAVSHSDQESTDKWVSAVGGEWATSVIVDHERELYGAWGLGICSTWHLMNPWSMYSLYQLGKQENIWNRPTESGSRWQTSGSFAVDGNGVVRWAEVAQSGDHMPDFAELLRAVVVEADVKRTPKL
ncbi:MAG: hypothetical protein M1818_004630 [Claussenomyces sp. TS43310]|nr:MAG: hypothetical protein M1818_004630 [Claussenomyces sp. TS43310]